MIIGITIVLLAVVAAVFGLVRSHLMARSNERLAMIQAGLDIDDFERKRGNNPILLHLAIVILSRRCPRVLQHSATAASTCTRRRASCCCPQVVADVAAGHLLVACDSPAATQVKILSIIDESGS